MKKAISLILALITLFAVIPISAVSAEEHVHSFTNYTSNGDATCKQNGTKTAKCDLCDATDTVTDEGSATGHIADDWVVTQEPTANNPGLRIRKCRICQASLDREILPATGNPFSDIPADSWYTAACLWCNNKRYITGTSSIKFSPYEPLTRAMFVQILAQVDGVILTSNDSSGRFADVDKDAWYAKAVEWAYSVGVTGGTSETTFSPDDPVTREQLAVFFMAYAKYTLYDTDKMSTLERYDDADDISPWAKNAVSWAVAEGLISGTGEKTISPRMGATRAQMAVIIRAYALSFTADAAEVRFEEAKQILDGVVLYPQKTGFTFLDNRVEALLDQLRPYCETTADLVLAVYDWLVYNVTYYHGKDYPYFDYNSRSEIPISPYMLFCSYSPLVQKIGVCDNYSATFAVVMRAIGFDAYLHDGVKNFKDETYGHAWAEVLIDGRYYIFDSQNDNYNKVHYGTYKHEYYCVPAEKLRLQYVGGEFNSFYDDLTLPVSQKKEAFCFVNAEAGIGGSITTSAVSESEAYRIYYGNWAFDGWLAENGLCRTGSEVTVCAAPDPGYVFSGWYAGNMLVSDAREYTFTVTGDTELEAVFEKE